MSREPIPQGIPEDEPDDVFLGAFFTVFVKDFAAFIKPLASVCSIQKKDIVQTAATTNLNV